MCIEYSTCTCGPYVPVGTKRLCDLLDTFFTTVYIYIYMMKLGAFNYSLWLFSSTVTVNVDGWGKKHEK